MADVYTGTSALDYDQTAWELAAWYSLRPELYFDAFADVKPSNESHHGAAVTFTILSDLAAASSTLSETTDVSAVALSDSQVTVTLAEYGNSVITTALARGTAFIPLDPLVANAVGYNAGLSLDTIARGVMQAGSNVRYAPGVSGDGTGGGTAPADRTHVNVGNLLHAKDARRARAELVGASVQRFSNGLYTAICHSDVIYDLKNETGDLGWRDPKVYSDPEDIYSGEFGAFEGFRWIESPRAPLFADASNGAGSTGTVDVYGTLFFGREAMAKAYSKVDGNGEMPMVFPGPVTDHLRRFQPMSWFWLGGFSVFRQAALRRVESASSIGVNT